MRSVLLWQTNHYKKMHNIQRECGSDFILFIDAFHVLCLYVPSSSISLTRNTHPLYLTQLHNWCMFSTLHLNMFHPICEPTTPLLPHFFGRTPYTAFRGPYALKGPCCFSFSMNWSFSEWPFTWISNVSHFLFDSNVHKSRGEKSNY